jgi:hypothetical protein
MHHKEKSTMKWVRGLLGGSLALIALSVASPAEAGWDNVFRTTCWHRWGHGDSTSSYYAPATSYYAPSVSYYDPCCNPCAQQVCTTRYIQRSYYQPVTTYQTRSYYEPVTSYRTSYYYAPVTSYKYTCCYDPCTCTSRMVSQPVTSWELRSQCNAVQSWVQRCCRVPVVSYQKVCYWEPQTCCSLVDPCTGRVLSNGATAPAANGTVPAVPAAPAEQQPRVNEFRSTDTNSPLYNKTYPPEGSGMRHRTDRQFVPATPKQPVVPKYDRITLNDDAAGASSGLVGRVVCDGSQQPLGSTQLVFVPETATGERAVTTTDAEGRFRVTLASGKWNVYVRDLEGRAVPHSQVTVNQNEIRQMTLVSR